MLLGVMACGPAAAAKVRLCQGQEQAYEQVKPTATTLEVNAALFSAADKGCTELARRLLKDGASLQARDRLGATPLSRAAKAGEAEIVDLVPAEQRGDRCAQPRRIDGALPRGRGRQPIGRRGAPRGMAPTSICRDAAASRRLPPPPSWAAPHSSASCSRRVPTPRPSTAPARRRSATRPAAAFPPSCGLLDHGVDPNARYGNDLTALMWAAGYRGSRHGRRGRNHHVAHRARRAHRR